MRALLLVSLLLSFPALPTAALLVSFEPNDYPPSFFDASAWVPNKVPTAADIAEIGSAWSPVPFDRDAQVGQLVLSYETPLDLGGHRLEAVAGAALDDVVGDRDRVGDASILFGAIRANAPNLVKTTLTNGELSGRSFVLAPRGGHTAHLTLEAGARVVAGDGILVGGSQYCFGPGSLCDDSGTFASIYVKSGASVISPRLFAGWRSQEPPTPYQPRPTGNVYVSGDWLSEGGVFLGRRGSGTFRVNAGGRVQIASLTMGGAPGSMASMGVDGILHVAGDVEIADGGMGGGGEISTGAVTAGTATEAGWINLSTGGGTWTASGPVSLGRATTLWVTYGGHFATPSLSLAGALDRGAELEVGDAGSVLDSSGTVFVGDDAHAGMSRAAIRRGGTLRAPLVAVAANGAIAGAGEIDGSLTCRGTVFAGEQDQNAIDVDVGGGLLSISGDLEIAAGAKLALAVGLRDHAIEADVVHVGKHARIAGTIDLGALVYGSGNREELAALLWIWEPILLLEAEEIDLADATIASPPPFGVGLRLGLELVPTAGGREGLQAVLLPVPEPTASAGGALALAALAIRRSATSSARASRRARR